MENKIKILFEDMSIHSNYEILDYGKNKNEMEEIAKKRGIKLPSKDIAIFKCKYAMVNQTNLNGCVLPRKEVEKSLESLNLKAIDKDHLRQSAVGMWLDSKLVGEDIVAYGGFWKTNFPEDYEDIKNRMKEGKMKISFEAWGDKEFNKDGTYNLKNIDFAGGALLFDSEPAFPNAEVMEFSNRVLEFAKIIEDIKTPEIGSPVAEVVPSLNVPSERKLIKTIIEETSITTEMPEDKTFKTERKNHLKRTHYFSDNTEETYESDIEGIETFSRAQVDEMINEELDAVFSFLFEGEELIDEDNKVIEESKKLTYKERKDINDDDFAVVVTTENKITGKPKKIRMFPIKDPAHVRNALARLPQATETLKKLGISVEEVKKKIMKKARELNMTDLLKRHKEEANIVMDELFKKYSKASADELVKFLDAELDVIKASLTVKDSEISTRDTTIKTLQDEKASLAKLVEDSKLIVENSKLEVEKLKVDYATVKADLDKRLADEKAQIVKSRKDELGEEYSKGMSDEDILNDLKFENSKLKKERDEAIKKASVKGLDAGAIIVDSDETTKKRKSVQDKAWASK